MKLDAVERRDAQRAEARVEIDLVRLGRRPDVLLGERPGGLAAAEIGVDARARKAVEPLDGCCESGRIDRQIAGEFRQRVGARNPAWNVAAARRVDEREPIGVLPVEDQIAGQVGVPVSPDVVLAQAGDHGLEIGLVGETPTRGVHHDCMWAMRFTDADSAEQRPFAGMLARDVEAQEHRKVVVDGAGLRAEFGRHHDAVALDGRRKHRLPARQALVGIRHLRVGLIGAAGEHHAAGRANAALVGDDADHAAVVGHELLGLGGGADRHAARQELLDEMGDDADAAGAHLVPAALFQHILWPVVDIGDAAPLGQLLDVDLDRRVARDEDRVLPVAKFGRSDELGVQAASFGDRARRHAEIMVGRAVRDAEPDAAILEELQRLRAAIDDKPAAAPRRPLRPPMKRI